MRQRRSELGWSQQAFAAKLGVTFQQVQKYEKGANQLGAARLLQACDVLNVPISYFLEAKKTVQLPKIDIAAVRAVGSISNERVKAALLRLARECHRL